MKLPPTNKIEEKATYKGHPPGNHRVTSHHTLRHGGSLREGGEKGRRESYLEEKGGPQRNREGNKSAERGTNRRGVHARCNQSGQVDYDTTIICIPISYDHSTSDA